MEDAEKSLKEYSLFQVTLDHASECTRGAGLLAAITRSSGFCSGYRFVTACEINTNLQMCLIQFVARLGQEEEEY